MSGPPASLCSLVEKEVTRREEGDPIKDYRLKEGLLKDKDG